MILFLRKHLHKNLYKIVLWMTIISMMIGFSVTSVFKRLLREDWSDSVATLDGEGVDRRDYGHRVEAKKEQLHLMRYQFEHMGVPLDEGFLKINPQQLALNSLLEEKVLDRMAKALNIHLHDEYASLRLADPTYKMHQIVEFLPAFLSVGGQDVDPEVFARVLRSKGLSVADFESYVERNLERKVVKDVVMGALYHPSFIIKKQYIKEYAAKRFSVLTITFEEQLKEEKKKQLTEEEVKAFFDEQNKMTGRYRIPEKRSGAVWTFVPASYGITISDEAIKEYYDQNRGKFVSSPAKVKVRRILFKVTDAADANPVHAKADMVYQEVVAKPETFAAKATEFSEDEKTAKQGGLVDFFAHGEKDAAFEKVAFKLKQDGEISGIVQTNDGFEIVQRVEKKAATHKSLESVKGEIRTALLKQEFKRRFEDDMERLQHASNVNAAIEQFVQTKHAKRSEAVEVKRDDSLASEKLFRISALGEFRSYFDADEGVMVQLTKIDKSFVPALEAVKQKVIQDVYKVKAQRALNDAINGAKKRAQTQSLAEVAKEYGAKVKVVDWITSTETDRMEKLSKEGLPLVAMMSMDHEGELLAVPDEKAGYVVRLEGIKEQAKEIGAKRQELEQSLYRSHSALMLNGFIASLLRNVTLRTHEKTVNEEPFEE